MFKNNDFYCSFFKQKPDNNGGDASSPHSDHPGTGWLQQAVKIPTISPPTTAGHTAARKEQEAS